MKISKSFFLEILQDEANQVLTEEITARQLQIIADKIIKKLDSIDMSMDLVYGALIGGKEATAVTRARQRAFGRTVTPKAAVNESPGEDYMDMLRRTSAGYKNLRQKIQLRAKDEEEQQVAAMKNKIIPLTKGGGGLGQSLRGKLEKSFFFGAGVDTAEFAKDVSAELAKLLQKNKILVQEKDIKVSELVSDWAREYNIERAEREVLVPYIKKWLVDRLKKKKYPKRVIAAIKESKQSIFEDVLEDIFYEV